MHEMMGNDYSYLKESLHQLINLNEDELFYKQYYEASESEKKLEDFLKTVNREDAVKRHLVIPEVLPEIISYDMQEKEYFEDDGNRNVYISRHNRYTPAFMHRHAFFEMIFVLSGRGAQNIGLKRVNFKEGDLIFIAPGVFHTMEVFNDETAVFNILLRKSTFYQMFSPVMKRNDQIGHFFSEGLNDTKRVEYLIFHMSGDKLAELQVLFLRLYQEHVFHDSYSDQVMVGILTSFTAMIMRHYRDSMETSLSDIQNQTTDDFLILNYIQNHLEDVSLSELADHFGFSVSYCSRMIKITTGQGFNDWKRTLRIRQAEHMLLSTRKTIHEIGIELGYQNSETFIRTFKKVLHLTPTQYRKQHLIV